MGIHQNVVYNINFPQCASSDQATAATPQTPSPARTVTLPCASSATDPSRLEIHQLQATQPNAVTATGTLDDLLHQIYLLKPIDLTIITLNLKPFDARGSLFLEYE